MPRKNGHDTQKYEYKRKGTIFNVRPVSGYYERNCDPYYVLALAIVLRAVDDIRLDNRYAISAKIFFSENGQDLLNMLCIGIDEMCNLLSNVGFECCLDDLILSQRLQGRLIKVKSF